MHAFCSSPWLRQALALVGTVGLLLLAPGVAECQQTPSVEQLARELLEGSRETRREAAYRLAQMGPDAAPAIEALTKALDDRDRQVWYYSIDAIANIGERAAPAVPKLIADLGTEDRQRWYRTAFALARIGQPAYEAIVQAVDDEDEERRAGAILALSFRPELARRAIPVIVQHLADPSELVRHQVVLALEAAGAESLPSLKQALGKDDATARITALRALARIRPQDREVQQLVLRLAADSGNSEVRAEALRTLAELRPPLDEAVERVIVAALREEEQEVRLAAMDVVLAYGQDAVGLVPVLAELAAAGEGERPLEFAALFERLGPVAAAAVGQLVEAFLRTTDPDTRATLRRTLRSFGPSATAAVRKVIEQRGASAADAVELLVDFGTEGVKELLALARSSDTTLQVAALRALAQVEDLPPDASKVVTAALNAPDQHVRAAALLATVRHRNLLSVDRGKLLNTAEELARVGEPALQESGVYTLAVLLDDNRVVGFTESVLSSGSEAARRGCLKGLAERGSVQREVLAKVGDLLTGDCPADIAQAGLQLLEQLEPADLEVVAPKLVQMATRHADPQVRLAAARLVVRAASAGTYTDEEIVRIAAELAEDDQPQLRLESVNLLSRLSASVNSEAARPLVLKLMRDGHADVRKAAIRLCTTVLEKADAVQVLATALEREPEWGVRREIFAALGEMGEDAVPAVPAILRRLRVRDDEDDALRALRRIRRAPKEAEPLLAEMLRSRSRTHRITAAVLLGTIEPPPSRSLLPELRRVLNEDIATIPQLRSRVEQTIRRIEGGR